MKYDFGQYVERRGSDSSKWDHQTGPFGTEGLLPFWVGRAGHPCRGNRGGIDHAGGRL